MKFKLSYYLKMLDKLEKEMKEVAPTLVGVDKLAEWGNVTEVADCSVFKDDRDFDWAVDDEFMLGLSSLIGDPVMDIITSLDPKVNVCEVCTDSGVVGESVSENSAVSDPDEVTERECDVLTMQRKAEYRQSKIDIWKEKRKRRTFTKKVVCKARGDVAKVRQRIGGRFVKTKTVDWVSVTSL